MSDAIEINPLFANHVTSIAFNLSLSKNMVVALVDVEARGEPYRGERDTFRALGMPSNFVGGLRGLLERGLVVAPDPEWPGACVLTEAGRHVFALLQCAGIIQRIENKVTQRSAA